MSQTAGRRDIGRRLAATCTLHTQTCALAHATLIYYQSITHAMYIIVVFTAYILYYVIL